MIDYPVGRGQPRVLRALSSASMFSTLVLVHKNKKRGNKVVGLPSGGTETSFDGERSPIPSRQTASGLAMKGVYPLRVSFSEIPDSHRRSDGRLLILKNGPKCSKNTRMLQKTVTDTVKLPTVKAFH